MEHPELITSTDVLAYVRNLLKDTKAEVELEWLNDDTTWNIVIYVNNGDLKRDHIRIKETMINDGFTLVDYDDIDYKTPNDCYSAIYWFA